MSDGKALAPFDISKVAANAPDDTFQHLGGEWGDRITQIFVERLEGTQVALDGFPTHRRGKGDHPLKEVGLRGGVGRKNGAAILAANKALE